MSSSTIRIFVLYNGSNSMEIKRNYDRHLFISNSLERMPTECYIFCNGWVTGQWRSFVRFVCVFFCVFVLFKPLVDNDYDKNYVKIIEAKRYSFVRLLNFLFFFPLFGRFDHRDSIYFFSLWLKFHLIYRVLFCKL